MVEYQHRNEGGGNMVQLPNAVFSHGEEVLVIPKQEFRALIEKMDSVMGDVMPAIRYIAIQRYDWLNEMLMEVEALNRYFKGMG